MRRNPFLSNRGRIIAVVACLLLVPIGYLASSALVNREQIDPEIPRWHVVGVAAPVAKWEPFSKLEEGDSIIVRLHSSGCFHESEYEFTFRRESEFTVSIVQLPSRVNRPGCIIEETARKELEPLSLSQADTEGLDRLMEFYHSNRNNGCIGGIDRIEFTQQRNGETVAVKQIEDNSCQLGEMKDVTTLWQLIDRVDGIEW